MHRASLVIILLIFAYSAKAQIPAIKSNTTESEKLSSAIYKNFSGKYDFMIAYTTGSYWWGDKEIYQLLAFKDGQCLKGSFFSKRRNHDKWSKPKIKFRKVSDDSGKTVVKYLIDAGFFLLNRDTLNIKRKQIKDDLYRYFTVDDGVNYRFEILSKNDFLIIESYMPEYFLEKIPELQSRKKFIECRDMFKLKYKTL